MNKVSKLMLTISGAIVAVSGLYISISGLHHSASADAMQFSQHPLTSTTISSFAPLGLKLKPVASDMTSLNGSHLITPVEALSNTHEFMHDFKGKTRNVVLMSVSEHVGTGADSSYATVSSARSKDDPNLTLHGDKWKDIPCYIVTIEGATNTIPPLGTAKAPEADAVGPSTVQVVEDATNGNVLEVFQIQHVH